MKTYRVLVKGWLEATGIYTADSPAKAKAMSFLAAKDAGYDLAFGDLMVRRSPEYDGLGAMPGFTEDHARHLLRIREAEPTLTRRGE